MKRWTVVLKTMGHMNSTGEYPFSVRAFDKAEAIEKAHEAFNMRDAKRHRPCYQKNRMNRPSVVDVFCWF
ncbi:MAG: hypothetical protein LC723_06195 [Actinobacteria bacterium]|nr:hypothetical protein [Actinomycetota bacterium]